VHVFAHGEDDDDCVRIGAAAPRERAITAPAPRFDAQSDSEQAGRPA
jgi:hypothetical protein